MINNGTTIGTCSICGGRVTVPETWMSINPPVPTCQSCGATAANAWGPVIPMKGGGQWNFDNIAPSPIDYAEPEGGWPIDYESGYEHPMFPYEDSNKKIMFPHFDQSGPHVMFPHIDKGSTMSYTPTDERRPT